MSDIYEQVYQYMCKDCENAHRCHNRCEECDEFQEELERVEKENKVNQIKVNGKICTLIRKVYDSFTDSHFYYTTDRDEPFCDLCDKIEVIECQNKD